MLKMVTHLKPRPKPRNIYRLQSTLNLLLDQLKLIIANNNLHAGKISLKQQTKVAEIAIHFDDLSPAILTLLGEQLDNFPIEITSITLNNPGKKHLISGVIQLNLWGN